MTCFARFPYKAYAAEPFDDIAMGSTDCDVGGDPRLAVGEFGRELAEAAQRREGRRYNPTTG
jgi:hypothetical protein